MASSDCKYESVAVDDPAATAASPPANEHIPNSSVLPGIRFPPGEQRAESSEDSRGGQYEYAEDWLVGMFYFILGALLLASVNAFNSSRFSRFFPPELYLLSLSVTGLRVTETSLAADFTADFFVYNNNWGSSVSFDHIEVSVLYNDDVVLGSAKSGEGFGLGPMSAREAEMRLDRTGEKKAHEPVIGPDVLRRIKNEVETDRVLNLGLSFKIAAAYSYGKDGGMKRGAEVRGECLGANVEIDPATGIGSLSFDFGMECSVVATFENEDGSQL